MLKAEYSFECCSIRSSNDVGFPAVKTVPNNPNGELPLDRYTEKALVTLKQIDRLADDCIKA